MVMYGYFRKEAAFAIDRRFAVWTCWTDRPSAHKRLRAIFFACSPLRPCASKSVLCIRKIERKLW